MNAGSPARILLYAVLSLGCGAALALQPPAPQPGGRCAPDAEHASNRITLSDGTRLTIDVGEATAASPAAVSVSVTAGSSTLAAPIDASPFESGLMARHDRSFHLANLQWARYRITLLLHRSTLGQFTPVAAVALRPTDAAPETSAYLLHAQSPQNARLAGLELLYSLVFRGDPESSYSWAPAEPGCGAGARLTQAEFLGSLVDVRNAAAVAPEGPPALAWTVAHTRLVAADAPGGVAVQFRSAQGPITGVRVLFSRRPHAGCVATSGPDGVARCVIHDLEDDGPHEDADTAPVIATFPGLIQADLVVPPTTLAIPAAIAHSKKP